MLKNPSGCHAVLVIFVSAWPGVMQETFLAKELMDKTSKADIDIDAQADGDAPDSRRNRYGKASRGKRYYQRSRFIETNITPVCCRRRERDTRITRPGYSKADILHLAEPGRSIYILNLIPLSLQPLATWFAGGRR